MNFIPIVSNIYPQEHKSKNFMSELSLLENKVQGQSSTGTVPSLQHLLDVISSIIAEEYIMIAKQNPEVFIKQGETK